MAPSREWKTQRGIRSGLHQRAACRHLAAAAGEPPQTWQLCTAARPAQTKPQTPEASPSKEIRAGRQWPNRLTALGSAHHSRLLLGLEAKCYPPEHGMPCATALVMSECLQSDRALAAEQCISQPLVARAARSEGHLHRWSTRRACPRAPPSETARASRARLSCRS